MKTATLEWLKAGELDLKTMEKLLDDELAEIRLRLLP
jgi:hypothetical protein